VTDLGEGKKRKRQPEGNPLNSSGEGGKGRGGARSFNIFLGKKKKGEIQKTRGRKRAAIRMRGGLLL